MKYHAVLSSLDLSWTVIIQMCYPGAHLIVISKFPHYRIMCNIEDAGWGIRDCLVWLGKNKLRNVQQVGRIMNVYYKDKTILKKPGFDRLVIINPE